MSELRRYLDIAYAPSLGRALTLTKKLDHKWLGPFVIEKVVSPTAIKLHLSPCKQGIHLVISVSNVHPYHPDPIPEHLLDPHPNPVLIDGSKEYEVESIVDSKYRYQCLHYLVKFKGWLDSNNEWLPADHLANAPDIVRFPPLLPLHPHPAPYELPMMRRTLLEGG